MARQLTPLGRTLLFLSGFSLLAYAGYKYGVLAKIKDVVAPAKRAEGTVSKDDFGGVGGGAAPATTLPGSTSAGALSGGSRLNRPIRVAIVLWGGYAGGIMARTRTRPSSRTSGSRSSCCRSTTS
jgi:hypothetical protein